MSISLQFGMTFGGRGGSIADDAVRLEKLGFDSIWAGEHVIWRHPMHDGLMTLAVASSVTKRVRLGTSILLMPLKHPILVAKAVVTLDQASNGRATLGVGVGGEYPKEFIAMGVKREERGPRTNEAMQIMKRLWTENNVIFKGRFWNLEDVSIEPKPIQKPHPPILVGGRRGSVPRTALYGDGWMPYMYTPEMYRDGLKQIEEIAHKAGRDPSKLERTLYAFTSVGSSFEEAAGWSAQALGTNYAQDFSQLVRKYPIVGTPQQCAERMQQFIEAGVRHFILAPSGPADKTKNFAEIYAKEIIPMLKKRNA
jgi:probable F420-dependent oxidoreductase